MEHGLRLPWWEFRSTDLALPGSVTPPDSREEDGLIGGFLQAAARTETADRFISAHSLSVAALLDALSRDELVLPAPSAWERKSDHSTIQTATEGSNIQQLGCRSRLFGMPLADRHAALNVACSLTHRIPRRALTGFLCRIVLGKDIRVLRSSPARQEEGSCPCGEQPLPAWRGTEASIDALGGPSASHPKGTVASSVEAAAATTCRPCLARREWLDSFSARLLVVACRKLLWDRTLPEDESLALNRCLTALSEVLGKGMSRSNRDGGRVPEASRSDLAPTSTIATTSVGVMAVLAGVRRREGKALGWGSSAAVDPNQDNHVGVAAAGDGVRGKRRRSSGDVEASGSSSSGLEPPRSKIKGETEDRASCSASARSEPSHPDPTGSGERASGVESSVGRSPGAAPREEQPQTPGVSTAAASRVDGAGARAPDRSNSDLACCDGKEPREQDCLSPSIRQKIASVTEKVAAAGARGATSTSVKSAAAAAVSLLQEAIQLPLAATNADIREIPPLSSGDHHQQPLEVVCAETGLSVPKDKGATTATTLGCGDDLVMAVCDSFVTASLSLKNCLAFVKAVLVPRVRALTTPASRLLVSAVSTIGKARPGVMIDGLIVPLLCEGNPTTVGSAQCELCTRLIKQVLPKHNLEAVLVGLCGPALDERTQTAGRWGRVEGSDGGAGSGSGVESGNGTGQRKGISHCIWTDLTVPVITAALNLKPALSDTAIASLVRGVEAAVEQPKMQKSLKFTTFIHSLVTKYGPQLKAHVPVLRVVAGRCSTFMVKALLAALQRLDKKN